MEWNRQKGKPRVPRKQVYSIPSIVRMSLVPASSSGQAKNDSLSLVYNCSLCVTWYKCRN